MTQLTRRSLLGGVAAVGTGTIVSVASQASARGATPLGGNLATATAVKPAQTLQAPSLDIRTLEPGTASGLLFLTAQGFLNPTAPRGPQIVDNEGNTIWFNQIANGTFSADFRVQTYRGEQVLTWWEGTAGQGGIGYGVGYIANSNYEIIATVESPIAGGSFDLHEFLITPEDTAVAITYMEVPADLSSIGGPSNGMAWDCIVSEVNIETGESIRDWHSIDHVPVEDTQFQYQPGATFDYMHANGCSLDVDGNLLVSGRHANAVYKVDRMTGEVIWRLGGAQSDFTLGAGGEFVGHHDGQGEGGNVYRVFDNQTQAAPGPVSRVIWLEINEDSGTAQLVNEIRHPEQLTAVAEGNAQRMSNDNVLVSWGQASRISEFTPSGQLLFDAALAQGTSSYRVYRTEWEGQPASDPKVAVDGATGDVHAVWNGATSVASWRVLGDTSGASGLSTLAQQPWKGADTTLKLPDSARRNAEHVQIQALDKRGNVLGTSLVTSLSDGRTEAR